MGVENNECVIATTWDPVSIEQIKAWIAGLHEDERKRFVFIPSVVNYKTTIVLGPDGSKKGWKEAEEGEKLRDAFIENLKDLDYEDGSNPFDFVEVGYGEFGQKVLRGNCTNKYDDREYAG